MKKLVIGIAGNIWIMEDGMFPGIYRSYVNHEYVESICNSGGVPIIIPMQEDGEGIQRILSQLDGLVLSGGYDIDPFLYEEEPSVKQGFTLREIDAFYIALIQEAKRIQLPVLGICKGHQALNVAFKGTLYQDLETQKTDVFQHDQKAPRENGTHRIAIQEGSLLSSWIGTDAIVNSYHHQAVKDVADGFTVVARAKDGVIEAIEKKEDGIMIGVQWHPEMMAKKHPQMKKLFAGFLELCKKGANVHE